MKIKITHDYQGHLIPVHFYVAGTEIEVDEDTGQDMIRLGHAELVPGKPKRTMRKKATTRPPKPDTAMGNYPKKNQVSDGS